jgi:glycosyltransferase involved in cell wall biosynthesis
MPTKIGEFLATGRPVVVSPGIGDMDSLLGRFSCGVVLDSSSVTGLDRATDELLQLLDDDGTAGRCRALAEEHFSLDRAVDILLEAYSDAIG